MSAVDFRRLFEPLVLKETGPAITDQARIHPLAAQKLLAEAGRPHAPCQTLPRPLNSPGAASTNLSSIPPSIASAAEGVLSRPPERFWRRRLTKEDPSLLQSLTHWLTHSQLRSCR